MNQYHIYHITKKLILGFKFADSGTWEILGRVKRIHFKKMKDVNNEKNTLYSIIFFSLAIWILIR